jgi:hypothetical protein
MKGFRKLQIVIDIANGTTVTGSAVTLKQATAVAGTGEKALAFTRMLANIDLAAAQTMVETAVVANTFTTDTTNSKNLRYIIEVDAERSTWRTASTASAWTAPATRPPRRAASSSPTSCTARATAARARFRRATDARDHALPRR